MSVRVAAHLVRPGDRIGIPGGGELRVMAIKCTEPLPGMRHITFLDRDGQHWTASASEQVELIGVAGRTAHTDHVKKRPASAPMLTGQ